MSEMRQLFQILLSAGLFFLRSSVTLSTSSVMYLKFTTAFEYDAQNLALSQFCGISARGINVFFSQ